MIRHATHNDLEAVVALGALKRTKYAAWQPVFHRVAADAERHHHVYLGSLIGKPNTLFYVSEEGGKVDGFLVGALVGAPPVYAPGGTLLNIDDFHVEPAAAWAAVGKALLEEAQAEAKKRGAVLVNVVCGPKDEEKRALLGSLGLGVASEWRVKEL